MSHRIAGPGDRRGREDAWQERFDLARSEARLGDLLVLADEAPSPALRGGACTTAAVELCRRELFPLALEYVDRILATDPASVAALREKGMCLHQLALAGAPGHSFEHARTHCRSLLAGYPHDADTWALLGRVDRDSWVLGWHTPGSSPERMRVDAIATEGRLHAAIGSSVRAWRLAPGHYRHGIEALTLLHLYRHLTGDGQHDVEAASMAGAVRAAAANEPDGRERFWSRVTLAELEALLGTAESVSLAYAEAIVGSDEDRRHLASARTQLEIQRDLGFRPEVVGAALAALDGAAQRLPMPAQHGQPRQVLLFSGHMVDAPGRKAPRFPIVKAARAADRLSAALHALGAGPDDMAICQAAAGGDLLFLDACQQRGVLLRVHLPFTEPEFVERSIAPSTDGTAWCDRFKAIKARLRRVDALRIMPAELGPVPDGVDPYERCNRWLLDTALACGIEKVRFICLWDGERSDGPGGTAHMYDEVRRRTARITWIHPRDL